MHQALIEQFHQMTDTKSYSTLLIETPKKTTDELAFCIAYSPLGQAPPPDLLQENVQTLFDHDTWIHYADIIDLNYTTPNYASTITYSVLEENISQTYTYPSEIYYWYVVHPKLGSESPELIYDHLWRNYLTDHNDRGYPRLQELITPRTYLWDTTSYRQNADRLLTESITTHPTAIEACSYWIGKTVPAQAIGSRPIQPNIIAHEHNGWCGELARLATATHRAVLIPTIGAYNVGEDHVWREFYHQGWHQSDNYWTDSGGTIDYPDEYAYRWGKNMSAIYQWRGDNMLTDVTARYIHPGDRITVTFDIFDQHRQPVDGARIVAVVQGPKDITWYKVKILELLQTIWEKIPDVLRGKLANRFYEFFEQKITDIPDIIEGHTIATWNYSNENGQCTLTLGKNRDYLFVIQYGLLNSPWIPARKNTLRIWREPTDKTFHIFFPMITPKSPKHHPTCYQGDNLTFHLHYESEGYQFQKNFRTKNSGRFETKGKLTCYILDKRNYEKYLMNKRFSYAEKYEEESITTTISLPEKEWYIVFSNPTKNTHMKASFTLDSLVPNPQEIVRITTPSTTLFEHPSFSIGDHITISGVASKSTTLHLPNHSVNPPFENQHWTYEWNTTHTPPGLHTIQASTPPQIQDEILIQLIDATPPSLSITTPNKYHITNASTLQITGTAKDTNQLKKIDIAIDNQSFQPAQGTTTWTSTINISSLALGNHHITVRAQDTEGHTTTRRHLFVKNESGHSWGPTINHLFHQPEQPTNTSTIRIYANITTTSPYPIKQAHLHYTYKSQTATKLLYHYATNPEQTRHPEDPLRNTTNKPIYGCLLGEFPTNTTITYHITVTDTAHNTATSENNTIVIT